ncbi:MAG: glycosyltransferase family 4 protein [Oscillochloridaceae bacterium]|nr:glycosyltransferase family 4 protein [Chloroflexaceae bacterium]MDW8389025.1 glycosyltransferase family 4 protein [Oscillochloridaceae bacterium]
MKIVQISSGYYPDLGGIEAHIQLLSEALVRRGHQVTVLAESRRRDLAPVEWIDGVEVRRFPAVGRGVYRYPSGMLRYLRAHAGAWDVAHAHNFHALPLILACVARPAPLVLSLYYHGKGHTSLANLLHRLYVPATRGLIRRAERIVCVSEAETALVSRTFGLGPRQVSIVPVIVALVDEAHASAELPLLAEVRTPTSLLSVGRMAPHKRMDRLIAALPHLPATYTLTLVGDGPERERLERLAERYGVRSRVHLAGRVSDADLRAWYRRAGALASLSEAESFGRTIIEGLALGCRVVCSDIPAHREFARRYPAWVTLVPPDASDGQLATLIDATVRRETGAPPDLRPYTRSAITDSMLAIYAAAARSGASRARQAVVVEVAGDAHRHS